MIKWNNKYIFLKYSIINGILTGVYFVLYYLLIEVVGFNYVISNITSYVVTVVAAYYMTKFMVFRSNRGNGRDFIDFIAVRIIMMGINSIGLAFLVDGLLIGKYISFIIVNAICFFASFYLNKWIFTRKRASE